MTFPAAGATACDPLALGQRIVAVLETGRRTATYKLATLMALMDQCLENLPEDGEAALAVPVRDLAVRVLDIYWRQVRPLEGSTILRQSTQPTARILSAAQNLREASGVGYHHAALESAQMRAPREYEHAIADVALTLVRQPLHRLQRTGDDTTAATFLYDDSWMNDGVTAAQVAAQGGRIVLYPGVAQALARLSGLLKPTVEILWIEDVQRMNKELLADVPDLAGHLFGRDRVSLRAARAALLDTFGAACFYCGREVTASAPVDHVLPWSRTGIDGLANLVVACARCNGDKSETLPIMDLVSAVLDRDPEVLETLAQELAWPTQRSRLLAVAHGLYRAQPAGTPLWTGYKRRVPLDIAWVPPWLGQ